MLPPAAFIPLAESIGLIDALSDLVLKASLRQCRLWRDTGLDLAVAVKFSVRNLHYPDLPDTMVPAEQVPGLLLSLAAAVRSSALAA